MQLQLPATGGALDALPVQLLGTYLAATLLASALSPLCVVGGQDSAAMVARQLVLDSSVGKLMQAASSSRGSSSGERHLGRRDGALGSSSSSTNAKVSSSSSSSSGGGGSVEAPVREILVVEAADGSGASDDDDDDEVAVDTAALLEYKVIKATEQCATAVPTQVAFYLTLARQLARVVTCNTVFVSTGGNVAATWFASAASSVLLALYSTSLQQQSQQRLPKGGV